MRIRWSWIGFSFLVSCATAPSLLAYALLGAKWTSGTVSYSINPQNADVSAAAAEAALQAGANYWITQSNASFAFNYKGTTSLAVQANDAKNLVFFRDAVNGSAIASTYAWWSGGSFVDADIIFWETNFTFYTGTSGCLEGGISNSAYIEDVATHEFGHFLGLKHSDVGTATMYPAYGYCAQDFRVLDPDDIAGIQFLYPPSAKPQLTLSKSASPTGVLKGGITTFTIQYQNTGTQNATSAVITDVVPSGSTLVPGSITSPVGVSFTTSGNTITWNLGTVNAGSAAKSVSFNVSAL